MASLPRAECRSCHRVVPVRVNGATRKHRIPYRGVLFAAGRQPDDPPTFSSGTLVCPGAGLPAIHERDEAAP